MAFGRAGRGFKNQLLNFFRAGNTIITGNGLFVYSGTPALGNLIFSETPPGIPLDPKGNHIISGAGVWYNIVPGGAISISSSSGSMGFWIGTLAAPWVTVNYQLFLNNLRNTQLEMNGEVAFNNGGLLPVMLIGANGAPLTATATAEIYGQLALISGVNMGLITPSPVDGHLIFNREIELTNHATPSAPGGGTKPYASAGHARSVSSDGNNYATERLTLPFTGQPVNSAAFTNVLGSPVALGLGKYRIRGQMYCTQNVSGGSNEFQWGSSGGLIAANVIISFKEINISSPGSWGNTSVFGSLGAAAFVSTVIGAGLGARLYEFDGLFTVTTAGTLALQTATTVAADTFNIAANSYMEISPV